MFFIKIFAVSEQHNKMIFCWINYKAGQTLLNPTSKKKDKTIVLKFLCKTQVYNVLPFHEKTTEESLISAD